MLENWAPVKSCKVNISTIYNTGQCSGDMDNEGQCIAEVLLKVLALKDSAELKVGASQTLTHGAV